MDYEFNAPVYRNFENLELEEEEHGYLEPVEDPTSFVAAVQEDTSTQPQMQESGHSLEELPDANEVEMEGNSFIPKPSIPKSSQKKKLNEPVRQSPRLAAIAKSIRRSNASRGLIATTTTTTTRSSSGASRTHRRSLSEGANIVAHFSKVEKKLGNQRRVAVIRPQQSEETGTSALTKDDLSNLEQMTQYKKILANNRQKSYHSSVTKGAIKPIGAKPGPVKPTKPVEFNFATDSRLRNKNDINNESIVDFTRTLRSHTAQNNAQPKGTTKVQPFNLHSSTKPKEVGQPFLSMAELSLKFHTKTPQRFRTKRYGADTLLPEATKSRNNVNVGVTHPQTPRLSTRLRARSVDHPSREEVEEKEFEEAQKHRFKAKPLNKKILLEPQLKLVETTKTATVPKPFNITDMKKTGDDDTVEKTLLESSKELMYSASSLAPIPHGGISSTWEKKSTEVKPFSFDSRDTEMMRKKKEKIKMMIEEEKKAADFHAQPMPVFDGIKGLPLKKAPTPTKVQPFHLLSDVRGSSRQEALQKELEALEELERKQRRFEAQPDKVLHQEPFVPQKSNKPLTDISGFTLNTDRRAEEREAFDVHLKEKEDELMAKKKEMEERKRTEEEAEVQEMRKKAVHKAQPVRHYKPVEIKLGLLPPTLPVSPDFVTDQRIKSRTTSRHNLDAITNTTSISDATTVESSNEADVTFTMEQD